MQFSSSVNNNTNKVVPVKVEAEEYTFSAVALEERQHENDPGSLNQQQEQCSQIFLAIGFQYFPHEKVHNQQLTKLKPNCILLEKTIDFLHAVSENTAGAS